MPGLGGLELQEEIVRAGNDQSAGYHRYRSMATVPSLAVRAMLQAPSTLSKSRSTARCC